MRARAWLQLVALLALAWLVMTTTHELGHVAAGWASGATLTELRLAPWKLPHSFYDPNPHPAVTYWGGPVLGVLVPLAFALVLTKLRPPSCPLRRGGWFVADFCVLANGTYLMLAWPAGDPTLDTARLLNAGVHPAWIVLFCIATIGIGYPRFRRDVTKLLRPHPRPSEAHAPTHADLPTR